MTDRRTSLENLQTALSMELTAVHQYLLHAHTLEDWGIDKLATKMREEMQEELDHAGAFIDRIMFLGGTPRLEAAKVPQKAESLKALFEADKDEEAGTFQVDGFDPVPRLQIITIEDAMEQGPRAVNTPLRHGSPYKRAAREEDTRAQGALDL